MMCLDNFQNLSVSHEMKNDKFSNYLKMFRIILRHHKACFNNVKDFFQEQTLFPTLPAPEFF